MALPRRNPTSRLDQPVTQHAPRRPDPLPPVVAACSDPSPAVEKAGRREETSAVTNKGTLGFDPARLKRLREAAGLNQSELARRAGIPRGYISKYELGQAVPNPDRLTALATALGVPQADLLDPESLGHGLAALRARRGLRQADVARLAGSGMTASKYRMLELGNVERLTYTDAANLARVFDITEEAVRAAHRWDVERAADS
jgi:transcriptional regulator with XRE-family HTH domain